MPWNLSRQRPRSEGSNPVISRLAPALAPAEREWLPALKLAVAEMGEEYHLAMQIDLGKLVHSGGDRSNILHNRIDFVILDGDGIALAALEALDSQRDDNAYQRWRACRKVLEPLGVRCFELHAHTSLEMLFADLLDLAIPSYRGAAAAH